MSNDFHLAEFQITQPVPVKITIDMDEFWKSDTNVYRRIPEDVTAEIIIK